MCAAEPSACSLPVCHEDSCRSVLQASYSLSAVGSASQLQMSSSTLRSACAKDAMHDSMHAVCNDMAYMHVCYHPLCTGAILKPVKLSMFHMHMMALQAALCRVVHAVASCTASWVRVHVCCLRACMCVACLSLLAVGC